LQAALALSVSAILNNWFFNLASGDPADHDGGGHNVSGALFSARAFGHVGTIS
jgi:hypothetical protein